MNDIKHMIDELRTAVLWVRMRDGQSDDVGGDVRDVLSALADELTTSDAEETLASILADYARYVEAQRWIPVETTNLEAKAREWCSETGHPEAMVLDFMAFANWLEGERKEQTNG